MQRLGRKRAALSGTAKVFGRILREIRRERGISQEELAFESGYHRTYISLLERGINSPSLDAILRLAPVLNTSASEIVARVEASDRRRSVKTTETPPSSS